MDMPPDAMTILFRVIGALVSVSAFVLSFISMRQAKDSKSADALKESLKEIEDRLAALEKDDASDLSRKNQADIKNLSDRVADHEKQDASTFSSIRERLHTHRGILRYLEHIPERITVLEHLMKVPSKPVPDAWTKDDDWENRNDNNR